MHRTLSELPRRARAARLAVGALMVLFLILWPVPSFGTSDDPSRELDSSSDRRTRVGSGVSMVVSRTSVTYHGGLTSLRQPRSGTGTLEESGYRWMGAPGGSETVRTKVVTEAGLKVDGSEFAQNVFAILNDPRGWQRNFQTVTEDEDLLVILASPDTVDSLCAPLDTRGYTSCRRGDKAIINVERWAIGAETFLDAGGTVQEYRNYLINHEVGHVLGYDHVRCEPGDELAPVMLQQTLTLGGCKPNGWPNPDGRAQG